jgi:hypothetical protein
VWIAMLAGRRVRVSTEVPFHIRNAQTEAN